MGRPPTHWHPAPLLPVRPHRIQPHRGGRPGERGRTDTLGYPLPLSAHYGGNSFPHARPTTTTWRCGQSTWPTGFRSNGLPRSLPPRARPPTTTPAAGGRPSTTPRTPGGVPLAPPWMVHYRPQLHGDQRARAVHARLPGHSTEKPDLTVPDRGKTHGDTVAKTSQPATTAVPSSTSRTHSR